MTTVPLYPAPTLPSRLRAEDIEFICAHLPDRFRLSERLPGTETSAAGVRPYTFRWLEVTWGPEWDTVGLTLEDGCTEVMENGPSGNLLEALTYFAVDEELGMIVSVFPARPWPEKFAVTFSQGAGPVHLGQGDSAAQAALKALMGLLRMRAGL